MPGNAIMLMGFATLLKSGSNPEIVLADRFPVSFLLHFLDKQKVELNTSVLMNAHAFGPAKSSKSNFVLMFFCLDTKEPKNQGSEKIG